MLFSNAKFAILAILAPARYMRFTIIYLCQNMETIMPRLYGLPILQGAALLSTTFFLFLETVYYRLHIILHIVPSREDVGHANYMQSSL